MGQTLGKPRIAPFPLTTFMLGRVLCQVTLLSLTQSEEDLQGVHVTKATKFPKRNPAFFPYCLPLAPYISKGRFPILFRTGPLQHVQ